MKDGRYAVRLGARTGFTHADGDHRKGARMAWNGL
jgi:hypothetical protein